MRQRLEVDVFEQQLEQAVIFFTDTIKFDAKIKQVDRLNRHSEDDRQPFSVVFSTGESNAYAQQIYTMQNPAIGEQMIFLVPIGPDETGMCYEAVFA